MIGQSNRPCPHCKGQGKTSVQVSPGNFKRVDCPACSGTGKAQLQTK